MFKIISIRHQLVYQVKVLYTNKFNVRIQRNFITISLTLQAPPISQPILRDIVSDETSQFYPTFGSQCLSTIVWCIVKSVPGNRTIIICEDCTILDLLDFIMFFI